MMQRLMRVVLICVGLGAVLATVLAQQPVSNISTTDFNFQTFIADIRTDLETLADLAYGGGIRPDTWSGNADTTAATIIADVWFDNEQLADEVFGANARPTNWIGATSSNAFLVTRNVRHDLELTADDLLGGDIRPATWAGSPAVYRCSRTIQNELYLLRTIYNSTPTTLENVFDYCAAVAGELEAQLISNTFDSAPQTDDIPALILAVRGDIERLADEKLGLGTRPTGWRANKEITSPNLAEDNFADLELLADTLLGQGVRPTGSIGSISATPAISLRNLRFDLELLADETLGIGTRPRGWEGLDPLRACTPPVQDIVGLVQLNYGFVPSIPTSGTNEEICADIEEQANLVAENPPVSVDQGGGEDMRDMAESRIAFAYLDLAATQFMGEMPSGIRFRAWYRNYNESSMMFISGDDFAVYVDRRWTTLEQEVFDRLPSLEGVKPLTFCSANWCNGPRATPTPTGDVLYDLLTAATPPATVVPGANTDSSGKQLVSWNHIRVNYVSQNSTPGKAQVTLEICQESTQITCEPVLSILNTATGVPIPVIASVNGLNVFELPYGYSTNLLIEGTTLFSQDVWLNDPTITGGTTGGVLATATIPSGITVIAATATP